MATTEGSGRRFLRRLVAAAVLDPSLYEEVERDRSATAQALAVILASSLAAGIGAGGFGRADPTAVAFFAALALVAWAAWALLTYEIGVRILPEPQTRADVGELLRTIGFASAPGMLRVFGLMPGMTALVFLVTAVWMLAAMVVGVRQALDFSTTRRAVAVCGLGWVLAIVCAGVIGFFFGPRVS